MNDDSERTLHRIGFDQMSGSLRCQAPGRCRIIDGMPLNRMLGREANLRVLRAITVNSRRLMWPSQIVDWTGLSRTGVWNALHRLEETLIIEPVDTGHGRVYPFRFTARNRLADPLQKLFWAEQEVVRTGILLDPEKAQSVPRIW